ncbi:DUF2194 domain-containing protein [Fictibacillus nanhaiensis]|uniref:DUF2194 domain-containing protein n=1 Tax=Fictibacillus nanhaiensis TaxID=742169 RepID=UPI001C984499|nr:DUF2194 domain-containing protein [Fictibacillus nanhaiensis]MBY6036657.1 DUF2194 domain-containing protein [Fictibacillus nanhaiensis]
MFNSYKIILFPIIGVLVMLAVVFYMNMDRLYIDLPVRAENTTVITESMTSLVPKKQSSFKVYLVDAEDTIGKMVINNIVEALDNAKIPYEKINTNKMNKLQPSPYHIVIFSGEGSSEWSLKDVNAYVQGGGNVMFTTRFFNQEWNELLGIKQKRGFFDTVNGITFTESFFPGYPDLDASSSLITNSMLDVDLAENTSTYLFADNNPLLWKHSWGKGQVIVWNGTGNHEKVTRGLVVQSFPFFFPFLATHQFGGKVMYIDDFPAPILQGEVDKINKEYGMLYSDFFQDVWWDDMKKVADQYDLLYTGAIIGSYSDDPALTKNELLRRNKKYLLESGRKLLQEGGELSLHGYNHQSLVTNDEPADKDLGYRPWKDRSEMEASLQEMKKVTDELYPNETIKTYVPPSNVLNETGKEALVKSFPELEVIASLYTGSPEKGTYVQEFGYDQEYKQLYHFPRISSGYHFNKEDQYELVDTVANFGVMSHFVHPDDVIDENRSNQLTWKELKETFETMNQFVNETYPYFIPLKQLDAKRRMEVYEKGEWSVTYSKNEIEIHGYNVPNPSMLTIYTENGRTIQTGSYDFGEVLQLSENHYVLKLTKPDAKISVKEEGR